MKILVTGSAGFIGFHTAKTLLNRGDEVIGFDNFNDYYDPALKEARNALLEKESGFTLIRGDLLDANAVLNASKNVDRIIHLAAIAGVRHSIENPKKYIDTNIIGTFHILDSVVKNKIPGLVYASTSSVYGGNDTMPFSESDPIKGAIAMYGTTKHANELMAHTYHVTHNIHATGLRFFTVYGPWGRPDMALYLFANAIAHDQPIQIFGEGKMKRDFTYIDDIVSGIIAAADKNYPDEIFNLGCGKQEELMEYIHMIEQSLGKEAKKEYLPMQQGDVRATSADISHAKEKLGFSPETTIAKGVPQFIDWFKEYHK